MFLFVSEGKGHDPGSASRGGHVEIPDRIDWCLAALNSSRLELTRGDFGKATREELARVHHPRYLDELQRICELGGGLLPNGPTYIVPSSLEEAERAAGAAVAAALHAFDSKEPALALVRPPGHHAESGAALGFCLINNAAVAAKAVRASGAHKVAIVDIDVHHGNGTQEIFWDNGSVLYLSLHQYPWYPYVTGSLDEVGEGDGADRNVNIPLPAGSTDETYREAFRQLVEPIVSAFDPDFLVVSAGFDAHERDDISLMDLTTPGFAWMASSLRDQAKDLCEGRLLIVLEGGYDRLGLGESLSAFVAVASSSGETVELQANRSQPPEARDAVRSAASFHLPRWGVREKYGG